MNSEKSERERGKSRVISFLSPSPPLLLFIGEVGEEVLFMPLDGVCIYRNATRDYK
jgi:hypothetical protein